MSHKSITNWFQSQNSTKQKDKLLYFYLVWDSKIPEVTWTNHKPSKFNFSKTVKVGYKDDKINIALYGYLDQLNDRPFKDLNNIPKNPDYVEYTNSSLLKSIIQKSIRRHDADIAIRASFHLMRLKIIDFLRRITIIAIEDSCMHNHLSLFVWFMMAYPHINFTCKHIRYFLGIVYYLSVSKNYDRKDIDIKVSIQSNFSRNIWNLYGTGNDLLKSIYIRKLYGGMSGDLQMLENVCITWYNRCNGYNRYPKLEYPKRFADKIRPIQIKSYLSVDDIPSYCVDFHCYPCILTKLNDRYPNLETLELKKLIWNNSSKINYRVSQEQVYCQKWLFIEKDFDSITTYFKKYRY